MNCFAIHYSFSVQVLSWFVSETTYLLLGLALATVACFSSMLAHTQKAIETSNRIANDMKFSATDAGAPINVCIRFTSANAPKKPDSQRQDVLLLQQLMPILGVDGIKRINKPERSMRLLWILPRRTRTSLSLFFQRVCTL